MYRVLIDTSVWLAIAGNPKRFPELAIVEEMVKRRVVELIVPTLAILEFSKNRHNFAHRAETDLLPHVREVRKAAHRIGGPEKAVTAFLQHLTHLAAQAPIEGGGARQALDRIEKLLLASPSIQRTDAITEAAVQRGIDKLAPFHDRNGMADAILLETYAECVASNTNPEIRFAFVTGDKDDFSAPHGHKNLPHPDIEKIFASGSSYFFFDMLTALNHIDVTITSEVLTRDEPTVASVIEQFQEENSVGQSGDILLRKIAKLPIGAKKVSKLKPSDVKDHIVLRRQTVGASTVQQDVIYLNSVFKWAQQNIGANVSLGVLESAKQAATKEGLISKSKESAVKRLSTEDEQRLAAWLAIVKKPRKDIIPMAMLMTFAIWSTRRQNEICKLQWKDFDEVTGLCKVRDMYKTGKDLTFRLVGKALAIVIQQREISGKGIYIFPYNPKSMGAKFTRAKNELEIDFEFDGLRDEGIRRLLESKQYSVDVLAEVAGDGNRVLEIKRELDAISKSA